MKHKYTYLTTLRHMYWWFVIAVHPDNTTEFIQAFVFYDDACWYGSTQPL